MKVQKWLKQILVFLAWAINSALGFWMMVVVRNAMLSALAVYYVGESMPRAWRARFLDRAYFVIVGLVYLIFIFAVDGYLRDGLPQRDVFRRFARVAGIQLLVLFPAELFTSLLQRSILGRFSLFVLPVELILGAALLIYPIYTKPKRHRKRASSSKGDR
ncbi:MAG: hypothetical protein ACP5HG_12660 [Anaerolineae bacterium]